MLARQVWELKSWLQVKNIKPRAILALEFQTMFLFSPVTWCGLGGGETVLVRETARNVHCRSGQGHLDTPVSFLCPSWTEGAHPPFRVRALVWGRPMPTADPT